MAGPLDGLRVIDAASWIAAPAAAGLMSDMGADVIKIEPPEGDTYRWNGRTANPDAVVQAGWENDNRGKRGVALDLDRPGGREVLLRLCDTADVFLTNFTRQRAERYGLTFEEVRERCPRIVYLTLSGYGSRGPDADRLATDYLAFWARGGIQSMIGDRSAPPVLPMSGQGDHTTTLGVLAAVLAALRLRDRTDEGQRVEVSLQHTGLWTISSQVQAALLHNRPAVKPDRLAPVNPIANTYLTRDGRWASLRMIQPQRDWPRFCLAVDRAEWAAEFPDFAALTANAGALRERIEALFLTETLEHWAARLDAASLMWAPVAVMDEVLADPQLREMGAFEQVAHPEGGMIEMVSAPFQIAGAEIRVRRSAPGIGEHTAEVLSEAGFTAEEIASYAEQRAFG